MIDSSFKRGLSLWLKLSLISWCLLLWCERRRRHVRSNAEVDHLGLWRRQRQVQASEQRAQRNWSCNHTTFWFNWWHSFIHWMFILMYTMFGFYLLTLVLYSGMTSTILRQLLVQQRQKVLRHHHLLPPLPCNCSSRPRKRSMKYTPRLELRIIYAHFLDSYVTRYLFIKGRWLCHIFIEVLERSTRERHRGRHKGQRQSHRLLQKGRKCQP